MAAERAGVPAVVNVCEHFESQGHEIAKLGGEPWLPFVSYQGHIDTYSFEQRQRYISEEVAPGTEKAITTQIAGAAAGVESPETTVAFKGTLEEVITYYREKMWSDGLPIIPPTIEKVNEFLKYTDDAPDAILTVPMPPSYRQATPWTVAVNGVMAGCRPEYMPILVALAKAWGSVSFGIQDSGSTPGWAPLTILNGPIIKQLGFNHDAGPLTPGYQANSSMGRFWTLFKRNVAQIRVESTDKGCHGSNWYNMMPENEDHCRKVGWETFGVQRGFKPGDNVVTVMSVNYCTSAVNVSAATADEFLNRLDWTFGRTNCVNWKTTKNAENQTGNLVLALPFCIAQGIASGGYKKKDISQYLYTHSTRTAEFMESIIRETPNPGIYCKRVKEGKLPKEFCMSEDPKREVPVFWSPDILHVVVTGDPGRNKARVYEQNIDQGKMTSVKIELPKNWNALYNASQLKKDLANSGRPFL